MSYQFDSQVIVTFDYRKFRKGQFISSHVLNERNSYGQAI